MIKRVRATLIGLVLVLLALVIGAMPASAGRLAGGAPGTPAFIFELLQPGPPTGLTATAMSSTEVDLSWTAPGFGRGLAGFNVYDGTSSGGESNTPVNSAPITDTTFSVTGLSGGTTYYFVVTAVDASGQVSAASAEASAEPLATAVLTSATKKVPKPVIVSLAAVAVAAAAAALALTARRLRKRPRKHPPAAPPSDVRVVPDAGPPGPVDLHEIGPHETYLEETYTVRLEPLPAAIITTFEEIGS